jgi:acyl dehydratase
VATTYQRSVLLGVDFVGEPGPPVRPAPWDPPTGSTGPAGPVTTAIEVGTQDAHLYTECARIWNPIHTEWEAAAAAGLPFLLLHGTATLARAVSAVDDLMGDGRRRIGRITGRFAAPVPMPGALTIRAWTDGRFEVLLPDGSAALTDGRVHWRVSSP